jgi:hypothetical protein
MNYILRDIDIELWSKVKAEEALERKTMWEVILESLKWYLKPAEIATSSERGKRAIEEGMALLYKALLSSPPSRSLRRICQMDCLEP